MFTSNKVVESRESISIRHNIRSLSMKALWLSLPSLNIGNVFFSLVVADIVDNGFADDRLCCLRIEGNQTFNLAVLQRFGNSLVAENMSHHNHASVNYVEPAEARANGDKTYHLPNICAERACVVVDCVYYDPQSSSEVWRWSKMWVNIAIHTHICMWHG